MKNAREIAVLTLVDVHRAGAYSNLALKKRLESDMSGAEKRLATSLVYGVIKRQLTLDYIIGQYSKIKLKKISDYILEILRTGIYQLLYMDKIPQSAAVNESVKLSKRYGHGASAGFVNGVLHSVIRGGVQYPHDSAERLSVEESFPLWLCREWTDSFGQEFAKDLMRAMNREPRLCLRANTLKISAGELAGRMPAGEVSALYPQAVLCSGFDIAASAEYQDGLFTAQDISAMLAGAVLAPKKGETVIDLCAAPGGKTTHLAQLMENAGRILAFDIHAHKIKLIEENAKRMGISIIEARQGDAAIHESSLDSLADKVLADVPCSGLGIIRRKPEIKWNKKEESNLEQIQYSILENAARYVKPGGEVVYSTCTLRRQENEDIIRRFLAEHRAFAPVDFQAKLPQALQKDTVREGHVTFYPNTDGIDGFFIAKLKRCE